MPGTCQQPEKLDAGRASVVLVVEMGEGRYQRLSAVATAYPQPLHQRVAADSCLGVDAGATAVLDPAELLERLLAEKVATFKRVREVEFVDGIPKNASGKLPRRMLVEQERAQAG